MTTDRCPHAESVAAYLLGALSDPERTEFEAHLGDCGFCCASDVAALRRVVDILPASATPVPPPLELRERIMDTVRSEAELLHAAGPSADRPRAPRARRRSFGVAARRPLALAAAAAFAFAGLLGFGLRALTEGGAGPAARTVQAQVDATAAPQGSARIVVRGGVATLQVAHMPSPPPGHVYEVWLKRRGVRAPAPTDALFSVDRNGSGRVSVPSVRDVEAVLVTAEPDGGSAAPTRQAVITAAL